MTTRDYKFEMLLEQTDRGARHEFDNEFPIETLNKEIGSLMRCADEGGSIEQEALANVARKAFSYLDMLTPSEEKAPGALVRDAYAEGVPDDVVTGPAVRAQAVLTGMVSMLLAEEDKGHVGHQRHILAEITALTLARLADFRTKDEPEEGDDNVVEVPAEIEELGMLLARIIASMLTDDDGDDE